MQNLLADYVKLMLVLAGIVALAYAALRLWLPKLSGLQQQAKGPIQVLARMPLEPRKNLYIIKAGADYLLVGTAENSVHMISPLQAEALAGYAEAAVKPDTAAPDFLTVLRRLKRS
jgi:flagellar biogenesis protein FliO